MAYDEKLAGRIRKRLARRKGVVEKKMFGGIAFLLNGNMCCGVHRDQLVVRIGADAQPTALKNPHARVFDITGKPMKGWVMVKPKALAGDAELKTWMQLAVDFVSPMPAK